MGKAQKEKMSLREQEKQRAAEEKKRLEEQLERAEMERRKAAEIARAKEIEEENRKYEEEKRRKREAEKQRQLEYEQQRKAELQERQEAEAAKEAAKRKAEEERRKEEESADESRKAREQQRKAALEELQKVRRQSQAVREDIAKELAVAATADDKENIPKNGGPILPADLIEKKSVEEQKRRASYGVVKNVLEQDSVHRKEAESVVAASRKAAEEVADVKTRIEASMERSGRGEMEGPVYYGINSTARRSSQDCGGAGGVKKDINVINDDLADEIEAIR